MKDSISHLLGSKTDKVLSVVLDRNEVIVNIDKIVNLAEYRVTKKVKPSFTRVYLSKI